MNVIKATRDFERWLARQIPLVRSDVALKHQHMAESPFFFARTRRSAIALLHGLGDGQHALREQARDSASETRFGVASRALAAQSVEGDARGFYGGLGRLGGPAGSARFSRHFLAKRFAGETRSGGLARHLDRWGSRG